MLQFWSNVRDVTFFVVWLGFPILVFLPRLKKPADICKRVIISIMGTWTLLTLHHEYVHRPVAFAMAAARGNTSYDGVAITVIIWYFGWIPSVIGTAVAGFGYSGIQHVKRKLFRAGAGANAVDTSPSDADTVDAPVAQSGPSPSGRERHRTAVFRPQDKKLFAAAGAYFLFTVGVMAVLHGSKAHFDAGLVLGTLAPAMAVFSLIGAQTSLRERFSPLAFSLALVGILLTAWAALSMARS